MGHLRQCCSNSRTITASACSRDSVVVWIIFLRLAGPFPIHASTSFRGVSLSSMDAASSTICTTCLACWVMSTVVKSGSGRSQRITNSIQTKWIFTCIKNTWLTHATMKTYHTHTSHTFCMTASVTHLVASFIVPHFIKINSHERAPTPSHSKHESQVMLDTLLSITLCEVLRICVCAIVRL